MGSSALTRLSTAESNRLKSIETTIGLRMAGFVEVGKLLMEIRDTKLYRDGFKTFEDYCQNRWQLERAHAYRLIDGASVVENVSHGRQEKQTPLPANERQARVLSSVPAEQQPQVWEAVVASAPINAAGSPVITAKHVQSVVDEFLEEDSEEEPTDVEETYEPGIASMPPRKDHSAANQESDALFHLKQWWKKAGKKDRTAFLKWTKE